MATRAEKMAQCFALDRKLLAIMSRGDGGDARSEFEDMLVENYYNDEHKGFDSKDYMADVRRMIRAAQALCRTLEKDDLPDVEGEEIDLCVELKYYADGEETEEEPASEAKKRKGGDEGAAEPASDAKKRKGGDEGATEPASDA